MFFREAATDRNTVGFRQCLFRVALDYRNRKDLEERAIGPCDVRLTHIYSFAAKSHQVRTHESKPHGRFDLRIFRLKRICDWRRTSRELYMIGSEFDLGVNAINPIRFIVVCIVTEPVLYIENNK